MSPKLKLFVATPAFGCMMSTSFLTSLIMLRQECHKRGIGMVVEFKGNESLVTRARNLLAEKFIQSDCTHLLFIDADISFLPDAVMSMLAYDKDIMTSIYAKKTYRWADLMNPERQSEPAIQRALDFNLNIKGPEAVQDKRYVRVLDSATGFMMIKRSALERMKSAYKSLTCINDIQNVAINEYVALFECMIDPETRRYLSEDFAFCRRWQLLGGEIWADIGNVLGHEGGMVFHKGLIQHV
jgi:hypothetical protein